MGFGFCMLDVLVNKVFVFVIFIASLVFIYIMRLTEMNTIKEFVLN